MKLKNLFAGMILCLAVASCIQDEAQNVEAAIDGCSGNHIQQYLIDRNDFTIQLYVSCLLYTSDVYKRQVKVVVKNRFGEVFTKEVKL